ncbi:MULTISPECIES: IS5 family transposase [unclassified Streptomyces]|uniref:IS5 family transposase n=1 Tax=unclassified Streptomyces TaxID=2593676 RepID=UPI00236633B7|nr:MULTISPECIES: IS5 family transposase [unclassified Streptomyces]MDF3142300.1 IS5 family transposase [Streptomyces sp. T21Q-yed]WDF36239.1 IS5 family transposase [Streptomyces sp. T12]
MMLPCYHYPSDASDLEWALLERLLPTPACQTPKGGAPEKWPRRRVVDSIRYIVDNGAKWRALPADFGIPWRTVFGYFARWAKAGVLKWIFDQLRRRLRLRRRRCPLPVRVIVDSQSVKGAETVSNATRGCDANKHINGRKRHLLVDQDGLLVDLLVTPADVQDRDAARILLTRLHAEHPEIVLVWADDSYGGEEFSTWAQDTLGITIKVVPRPKDADGFVVLPKRWVIERSNSWTMRARRNARDYERLMAHAEAHIQWAFITLMTRRLTRPRRQPETARSPSRQPPENLASRTDQGRARVHPEDGACRKEADMGPREEELALRHQAAILDAYADELERGYPCPWCGEPTVHFRDEPAGRNWCPFCDWDPPEPTNPDW